MHKSLAIATLLAAQYQLVQSARAALLAYCGTLLPAHFVASVPEFPQQTMAGLLTHCAAVYASWLGQVALGRPTRVPPAAEVADVAAVRQLFAATDALVADFITSVTDWETARPWVVPGQPTPLTLAPLQLFTHVVTHEFHHKGQLLTMSRLLGYAPVDTDIIRF